MEISPKSRYRIFPAAQKAPSWLFSVYTSPTHNHYSEFITINYFAYSWISCKWNNAAYILLALLLLIVSVNLSLLHVAITYCSLLLHSSSLYSYTTIYFICSVNGNSNWFQVFAITMMVLWTFLNMSYSGHRHSFLLDNYLGAELLNHKALVCLALVNTAK